MSKKIARQFDCSRMMLPEHCSCLRQYTTGLKKEENCPAEPDEQLLEERQNLLERALAEKIMLKITIIDDKERSTIAGIPAAIDQTGGTIVVAVEGSGRIRIRAAHIVGLVEL